MNNEELIHYKYNNQEISTPTSEGYLTDFLKTKDWINWLQKEFKINQRDFQQEQFKIQYRSKNQPIWDKLFYTDQEGEDKGWKIDEAEKIKGMIYFPPIYLHPLAEDTLFITHSCGWKQEVDARQLKEHLKKKGNSGFNNDVIMLSCQKCGEKFQGLGKECLYRVCKEHMGEGRQFWINAWKMIGIEDKEIWEKAQWRESDEKSN